MRCRRTAAATTPSASAPPTAAARSRRCGTSARGTSRTTTGTPNREQWGDLPQGTPQAQAAFRDGYNGGKDGFGRKVANPAGIDLADGTFWDDLGLINNTTVTVDYLWTGSVQLAKVVDTGAGARRARADADVVGTAAHKAGVPVECTTGDWLRHRRPPVPPGRRRGPDIGPVRDGRARPRPS